MPNPTQPLFADVVRSGRLDVAVTPAVSIEPAGTAASVQGKATTTTSVAFWVWLVAPVAVVLLASIALPA